MEIKELKMKYPRGFESAVHMTKEELESHIRLMAALKMFELGKVSSGKAAELAGMSRVEFLETCEFTWFMFIHLLWKSKNQANDLQKFLVLVWLKIL